MGIGSQRALQIHIAVLCVHSSTCTQLVHCSPAVLTLAGVVLLHIVAGDCCWRNSNYFTGCISFLHTRSKTGILLLAESCWKNSNYFTGCRSLLHTGSNTGCPLAECFCRSIVIVFADAAIAVLLVYYT
jgi:hypothetical protein